MGWVIQAFDRTEFHPYHARAMANLMLARCPPIDLANRGQVIETKGKVSDFSRLVEIVEADLSEINEGDRPENWRQSPVDIRLRFGWADGGSGNPTLVGQLSTTVAAICQRCLEPFELAVESDLKLLLSQTDSLPVEREGYEVWEYDENDVRLADIVEEALIMAMPLSALHESAEHCRALVEGRVTGDNDLVTPFADLASRMAKAKNNN